MHAAIYYLRRWWLRRCIAVIRHRREELKCIIKRENALLDWEELAVNSKLRTLESDRMQRAADASLMQRR